MQRESEFVTTQLVPVLDRIFGESASGDGWLERAAGVNFWRYEQIQNEPKRVIEREFSR